MYKNIDMEAEANTLNHCKRDCAAVSPYTHKPAHTQALTLPGRVLVVLNEPGQAKISDLAHQIVSDENVSRSQVTVNVVHSLNVRHSSCNLQDTRRDRGSSDRR